MAVTLSTCVLNMPPYLKSRSNWRGPRAEIETYSADAATQCSGNARHCYHFRVSAVLKWTLPPARSSTIICDSAGRKGHSTLASRSTAWPAPRTLLASRSPRFAGCMPRDFMPCEKWALAGAVHPSVLRKEASDGISLLPSLAP